jgi:hypothetical protein
MPYTGVGYVLWAMNLDGVQHTTVLVEYVLQSVQLAIGHRPDFRDSISIMNEGMNFRVSIRECGTPCHACQVKSGVRES